MPTEEKRIKSARKAIYFDCICGSISSIAALIGIFVFAQEKGILYPINFTVGLIFWIGWLGMSIFLIGLGIHTYYGEKNYDPNAISRKKIKAPMV